MKEIIFNPIPAEPKVLVHYLTSKSIVGVQFDEGSRGVMHKAIDGFQVITNHPKTNTHHSKNTKRETLSEYQKAYPTATFYEFPTTKDCFKWLAE